MNVRQSEEPQDKSAARARLVYLETRMREIDSEKAGLDDERTALEVEHEEITEQLPSFPSAV